MMQVCSIGIFPIVLRRWAPIVIRGAIMIRILADTSAAKGKLLEELVKEILQKLGFDRIQLRCRRIGAEYDVEAADRVTKQEIIGECKALDSPLPSEHLFKWLGKYNLRCSEKPDCVAVFFTLSPLSSEARTLYEEIRKSYQRFVVHTPEEIMKMLEENNIVASARIIEERVRAKIPRIRLGNRFLVYTKQGIFWLQMILQDRGSVVLTLLDSQGSFVSESLSKEILECDPELKRTPFIDLSGETARKCRSSERVASKIVKPASGTGWFDYRYPSPPKYFVGRSEEAERFIDYIEQIYQGRTCCRGIVISGPSGIGKSSFILKLEDLSRKHNYLYIAADCRGCAGQDFLPLIMKTLKASAKESKVARGHLVMEDSEDDLFVLADQTNAMLTAGLIAVAFLDQFEYLIQYPVVVEQVKNLLLHLMSSGSKIVLGFAIKSDFAIDFSSFPFDAWSIVKEQSYSIKLKELKPVDVDRLIAQLQNELGTEVGPPLLHNIKEFSGNKPWILKRICSYLLHAKKRGNLAEITRSGLNLDQLFKEDVDQLTEDELTIVSAIAKSGPADLGSLSSPSSAERTERILAGLLAKRLAVHIGSKYDLYHEQFKKYVVETMLAREEQLQVQIDLYVKMIQVLEAEKKFSVIASLLTVLHRFYVKDKTSYRIEEVVRMLDQVNTITPLGYRYLELKARNFAKKGLSKESQHAYHEAMNTLISDSRLTTRPLITGGITSILGEREEIDLSLFIELPDVVEELRRIKSDSGDLDGARQAEKIAELLSLKNEHPSAFSEKLGKLVPEISDDTILRLIAAVLDKDVEELRTYIILLRESPPQIIARTLVTTFSPLTPDADFVRGRLSNAGLQEVSEELRNLAKNNKESETKRSSALRWLAKLDPEGFIELSTGSDLRLILRNIRAIESIPSNSVNSLVNLFLLLPFDAQQLNVQEKEQILHDFCVLWDDIAPHIPSNRMEEVIAHLLRLYDRNEKKLDLRWCVALFVESLIRTKIDSALRSADLLLRLASDKRPTIRSKAARLIGIALSTLTLQPGKRNRLRRQLESLTADSDDDVARAAFESKATATKSHSLKNN
jgi:hypothetical protein